MPELTIDSFVDAPTWTSERSRQIAMPSTKRLILAWTIDRYHWWALDHSNKSRNVVEIKTLYFPGLIYPKGDISYASMKTDCLKELA